MQFQATFPSSKRIMSQQAIEKVVLRIFLHKVSEDKVYRRKGLGIRDASSHVYSFLSDTYATQQRIRSTVWFESLCSTSV